MKTLDEVIKANECCDHGEPDSRCEDCPYNGVGSCCLERENDALHYLQDYRMLVNDIAEKRQELEAEKARYQEAVRNCEEAENKYRQLAQNLGEVGNPALTWEQLKTMEGKPVWYEHEFWKGWIILGKVEQGVNCEMIPDQEERWYIVKDGSSKAYRRERK